MPSNHTALIAWATFDEAVVSMTSTRLWQMDELRAGIMISGGPGIHVHAMDLPDLERFRSLMLDFRQLLNKRDAANLDRTCSWIRRLAQLGNEADTAVVAAARRKFHSALEQPASIYALPAGLPRPTIRLLLDDWMSGDWFHRDEERRQRRLGYEFGGQSNVLMIEIVPAVRSAISAAIEIDVVVRQRLQCLR